MTIYIRHTEIVLLPQKAIYFPHNRTLVLADAHLGKLAHFRNSGIFVPLADQNEDLAMLVTLIERFDPEQVIFLGDLFHSKLNGDYHAFIKTIDLFPTVRFTLTRGNHDILPANLYTRSNMSVTDEVVFENGIILRHQLPKKPSEEAFYIIGHVHPGYLFAGKGRQYYRLPCFHHRSNVFTLPAFGKHTGLFIPEPKEADRNYIIMLDRVIEAKSR